jgi:hypothetical protein
MMVREQDTLINKLVKWWIHLTLMTLIHRVGLESHTLGKYQVSLKEECRQLEILKWLQAWYSSQCNGDWEHGNGIRIASIDNPGWHVAINLNETELESKQVV